MELRSSGSGLDDPGNFNTVQRVFYPVYYRSAQTRKPVIPRKTREWPKSGMKQALFCTLLSRFLAETACILYARPPRSQRIYE